MKKILKRCIYCKRVQGQPYPTPPLAPVHPNRLNVEVPFRVTGLDYTGSIKVHHSHVDMVYVLLFTCAAMQAVALETTNSLTVVELVQPIRRFPARFKMLQYLVSDNASTFQAGQTLVTKLMQHPVIDGLKRAHNLTWKFITPRAPWHGGFYEGLIFFTKLNLCKATYRCYPTYDEFVTLVREVECVVNDRPLTYLDTDDPLIRLLPQVTYSMVEPSQWHLKSTWLT
ncbi:uncharacterized protein [Palaemon carinicauda]|uniref:uncharacterized protein n=1 Tax=Palaemon carinicauda TaxID=392227 RepID=UPI0035B5C898